MVVLTYGWPGVPRYANRRLRAFHHEALLAKVAQLQPHLTAHEGLVCLGGGLS